MHTPYERIYGNPMSMLLDLDVDAIIFKVPYSKIYMNEPLWNQ